MRVEQTSNSSQGYGSYIGLSNTLSSLTSSSYRLTSNYTTTLTGIDDNELYLFDSNVTDGATYPKYKFFSMDIYSGNTLKHKLRPYRSKDGVVGVIDDMTGIFYGDTIGDGQLIGVI